MSEYNSRPDPSKIEPEFGTPVNTGGSTQGTSQPSTYQPSSSGYSSPMRDGSGQQGMAEQAKEKASEYGEKAQEQAEQAKDQAADGMERAAEALRERSGSMEGAPAQASLKVAEGMETASTYLKEHNTTEMWSDVERYAKEHPGKALAGAVVTGFVLGRILR